MKWGITLLVTLGLLAALFAAVLVRSLRADGASPVLPLLKQLPITHSTSSGLSRQEKAFAPRQVPPRVCDFCHRVAAPARSTIGLKGIQQNVF